MATDRRHPLLAVLLVVAVLAGCNGGTSSSGPTTLAGTYVGTVTVAGVTKPVTVTVTADGFVSLQVAGGGVVCISDLPEKIGLDGDRFDSTSTEQCVIGPLQCPVNTIITGAISGDTVSGSGSILPGCGSFSGPFNFTFVAHLQ